MDALFGFVLSLINCAYHLPNIEGDDRESKTESYGEWSKDNKKRLFGCSTIQGGMNSRHKKRMVERILQLATQ